MASQTNGEAVDSTIAAEQMKELMRRVSFLEEENARLRSQQAPASQVLPSKMVVPPVPRLRLLRGSQSLGDNHPHFEHVPPVRGRDAQANFQIGDQVQYRDRGKEWCVGTVTSAVPLKVNLLRWDEVQPVQPVQPVQASGASSRCSSSSPAPSSWCSSSSSVDVGSFLRRPMLSTTSTRASASVFGVPKLSLQRERCSLKDEMMAALAKSIATPRVVDDSTPLVTPRPPTPPRGHYGATLSAQYSFTRLPAAAEESQLDKEETCHLYDEESQLDKEETCHLYDEESQLDKEETCHLYDEEIAGGSSRCSSSSCSSSTSSSVDLRSFAQQPMLSTTSTRTSDSGVPRLSLKEEMAVLCPPGSFRRRSSRFEAAIAKSIATPRVRVDDSTPLVTPRPPTPPRGRNGATLSAQYSFTRLPAAGEEAQLGKEDDYHLYDEVIWSEPAEEETEKRCDAWGSVPFSARSIPSPLGTPRPPTPPRRRSGEEKSKTPKLEPEQEPSCIPEAPQLTPRSMVRGDPAEPSDSGGDMFNSVSSLLGFFNWGNFTATACCRAKPPGSYNDVSERDVADQARVLARIALARPPPPMISVATT